MELKVKDVMKKKIWKIPIWLLIILLGIGAVSGAVMYTLKIPSTATILPPEGEHYEVKVYWDAECTDEITSIDFGTIKFDVYYNMTFYVKSLCDAPCDVYVGTSPVGGCYVIKVGSNDLNENFAPNEVREVNLTYWASKAIEHGTYNFDTEFNVYPAS